jgi:hypothetical protein
MMKRVLFSFVFALLLSFGLSNAMNVVPYVDPAVMWDDDGDLIPETIISDANFAIEIQMDNTEATGRGTVSMPLTFYGTGDCTSWSLIDMGGEIVPNIVMMNGFQYNPYPNPWFGILDSIFLFDWDGSVADTMNFTGSGVAGIPAGAPLETRLAFWFSVPDPDTTVPGAICVDSCSVPNVTPPGKYDWLWDTPYPVFNGPHCYPVKTPPNFPPEFKAGECPAVDKTLQWDEQLQFTLAVEDTENDDLTDKSVAATVEPDGTYDFVITDATTADDGEGQFTFNPTCDDVGSHEFTVGVTDALHTLPTGKECVFTVTVGNTAPVIAGNCGQTFTVGTGSSKQAFFTATDANTGDTKTWTYDKGAAIGPVSIVDGVLTYTPDDLDAGITHIMTVYVTDCAGDYDSCLVGFEVISAVPFGIVIEKDEGDGIYEGKGVLQGHHGFLDVMKTAGTEEMHGFDFLIGYDASVLAFVTAIDSVGPQYGWEYFTFRYDWNGNCGMGCPTGLLRVVGIANQNDGIPFVGDVLIPDGAVLFQLDFLISNNRLYECMYVPVYFYWMDCGDNTIAMRDRSADPYDIQTAVSAHVFWWDGHEEIPPFPYIEITDPDYGFPTMFGVQGYPPEPTGEPGTICFIGGGEDKPVPIPFIDFYDGGFDIICSEEIDLRGDMNLNGVANEIADAVVYTNYFIYSLAAFEINIEGQIAASEINGDGIVLTVADLVYLIRIVIGDALPLPKVAPNLEAKVIADGHVVTTDAEFGAAQFVFAGDVEVSLADGAAGMDIGSHFDGTNTNVMVYSYDQGRTASGSVLYANGNLISVEAADYNGNAYKTTILPADYGVKNYPNPFNAVATIKMYLPEQAAWNLGIYNVAGQRVANFSGNDLGEVTLRWDAGENASGIYFYKFETEKFSTTKKMVLLK